MKRSSRHDTQLERLVRDNLFHLKNRTAAPEPGEQRHESDQPDGHNGPRCGGKQICKFATSIPSFDKLPNRRVRRVTLHRPQISKNPYFGVKIGTSEVSPPNWTQACWLAQGRPVAAGDSGGAARQSPYRPGKRFFAELLLSCIALATNIHKFSASHPLSVKRCCSELTNSHLPRTTNVLRPAAAGRRADPSTHVE